MEMTIATIGRLMKKLEIMSQSFVGATESLLGKEGFFHHKGSKEQRNKGLEGRQVFLPFHKLCPFDPLSLCVEADTSLKFPSCPVVGLA
jgi:hypothetical protein